MRKNFGYVCSEIRPIKLVNASSFDDSQTQTEELTSPSATSVSELPGSEIPIVRPTFSSPKVGFEMSKNQNHSHPGHRGITDVTEATNQTDKILKTANPSQEEEKPEQHLKRTFEALK